MRMRAVCAVGIVALAVAGWLWSRTTADAPPLERSAPVADGRSERATESTTGTNSLADFALDARANERRAAAVEPHPTAAPSASAPPFCTIVANGTETPVEGASVRCIDSRGLLSEPRVEAGAFEPIGTPPFMLEIAAPEHATRWLVLKDAVPAHIDLWRAGSVEVLVVDEAGNALEGVRVTLASALPFSGELWFVKQAFEAKSKVSDRSQAVRNFVRHNDGDSYDHYGPRASISIGPVSNRLSGDTDAEGRVRVDGLPANTRFGAQTHIAEILESDPAGERRPWGDWTIWYTDFVDVAVDDVTRIRFVRRGTCSVAFDFVGRPPAAYRGLEAVYLLRKDDANADQPWVGADHVAASRSPKTSAADESTRTTLRALMPGEYALVAHWKRAWFDTRSNRANSETCIVERMFRLVDGQQLDLGVLDADPGVVELEFALVDGAGALIDSERCFPVPAETKADPSDDYVLFFEVAANVPGTLMPLEISLQEEIRRGESTTRGRVLGAPQGLPLVRIEPNSSIGLVSEPNALWRPVGVSEHQLPPQRDLSQRLPIELMALRDVSITLVHTRPPDSVQPEPARQALTLRRVSDGEPWLLECEWTTETPARLVASGPLPLGTWSFASPLVYARDEIERETLGLSDDWFLGGESSDFVAATAEWLWVSETIAVTEAGGASFEVAAEPAAAVRFVPTDASELANMDESGGNERVPKSWGALEVADERGVWSSADLLNSNAVDVLDRSVLLVCGLPPQRNLRLTALGLEFRTGAPGSTVEIHVPVVAPAEEASEADTGGR